MKRLLEGAIVIACLTTSQLGSAVTCSIGSVSAVSFGEYNIFSGTPLDSVGSLSYRCDDVGASDTIIIELSRGSSATYLPRTLVQGSYVLNYNLYLDAARTTIWGDGSSGTSEYGPVAPSNATDTTINVYGRITANQNAQAGTYSDTIVVTVLF